MKTPIRCILLALTAVTPSQAAFLLLDNMDYGGADQGAGVGDWMDGSNRLNYRGSENVSFSGDSDYVNDPANSGTGSLERNDNIDDRFFYRDYSNAGQTGEFWVSTLIQVNGAGASTGDVIGLSLNDGTPNFLLDGDLLGVGFDGTNFRPVWYDDSSSAANYDLTRTVSTPSTVLLIAKLNIGAGADSFSMWLFDSSSSFGLTEASLGAAFLTSGTADFGDELDQIQVGGIGGFDSNFDQIRISNSSGNAGLYEVLTGVPEPSSALLGSLAALLILRRRRK